jgi:hypothetical protein
MREQFLDRLADCVGSFRGLNAQDDPFYHPTLIGSQFFECIGLVKSLKVPADASLDS